MNASVGNVPEANRDRQPLRRRVRRQTHHAAPGGGIQWNCGECGQPSCLPGAVQCGSADIRAGLANAPTFGRDPAKCLRPSPLQRFASSGATALRCIVKNRDQVRAHFPLDDARLYRRTPCPGNWADKRSNARRRTEACQQDVRDIVIPL